MTERDELPEGWQILSDGQGHFLAYGVWQPRNQFTKTAWFTSRAEAIAAAWRIADHGEGDGR